MDVWRHRVGMPARLGRSRSPSTVRRLDAGDVTLTARTGHIRLHGKGDEVRTVPLPPVGREHLAAWLDERGTHDGPLWTGQRGRLTISGITQVVLAVGEDAGIPGLRPHASIETAARYFRAGNAEQAELTIPAPAPREVLTVSASVGVGALTVDLPAGTTARVTSAAGLGGITTPQGDTGGLFRHKQIQIGSGDPQVIIEAGVRIGSVTIRTPGPLNR